MKKILLFCGCFVLIIGLAGCGTFMRRSAKMDNGAGVTPLPPYSGPRVRIAVADFDVKAAKAGGAVGSGLKEMLVTALVNSNRFSVADRQALSQAAQEQELDAQQSAAQKTRARPADLIIAASVIEFEPQTSGGKSGIGGGGGVGSGVLGSLLGSSLNKAHMALDIRIMNTSNAEVLYSTRVQGQASDVTGVIMGGFFGSWGLGAGLSAYANTPMEKAIRICVIEAVRYISQTIPASYYKH